jgi:hypothetical protein
VARAGVELFWGAIFHTHRMFDKEQVGLNEKH